MTARVVVCCGSGGVGKTTISAALAVRWALQGQRVAVLTIDPARRLADSLGIGTLDNTPRAVPLTQLDPDCTGQLDAMMLDAKATFDDLIRRFSPSPDAAERILGNRYYAFASGRLGGAHEYMAMEKLLELWQDGPYDVIVLDTPPTRHALDFLRAPDRMSGLMDQGVLRWLVMPASRGGWRALELGSDAVARVLKGLLGRGTVTEIADFFEVFRSHWEGFRERSDRVQALLRDPHTRFLLVTSPAPAARTEALYFLEVLEETGMPFGGFVVNRVLSAPEDTGETLPTSGPLAPERWAAIRQGMTQALKQRAVRAAAHRRSIEALRAAGPPKAPTWTVPDQGHDLHDLQALGSVLSALPRTLW